MNKSIFQTDLMEKETLTEQELLSDRYAEYDVSAGYPKLSIPEFIKNIYKNSIKFLDDENYHKKYIEKSNYNYSKALEISIKNFFKISLQNTSISINTTFSGSIAIDRTVAALLMKSKRASNKGLIAITTTPSIDVVKHVLDEHSDIKKHYIKSNAENIIGFIDTKYLISCIREIRKNNAISAICLILSSPENPTGTVFTRDELFSIALTCKEINATLVVDHCFAVAGVHDRHKLTKIWDLINAPCEWIAIWDTDKTFPLEEDKLGFVIASNEDLRREIKNSIGVLQFDVSKRLKILFEKIFNNEKLDNYLNNFQLNCIQNMQILNDQKNEFKPIQTTAGSVALLDMSHLNISDEEIFRRLLKSKIGVTSASSFFHTSEWSPNFYIRVALAREVEYFSKTIEKINFILR